ncbi:MAG TPA: nucleoside hydrolase [Acidimicrobiia bacterium]|nr:nucleoside hydrolase [Acidimicrobiia bacterium]
MRLWIDTDVGTNIDDAVALLAAVSHPAVELVGVSTVGSDPERRAAAAVGLLASAGVDLGAVVVCAGSDEAVTGISSAGAEALLAIGPLTNVAAMTAAGVRPPELTIMGGALHPVEHRGELRAVEHNFASDPDAAATVLAVPGAVLVPLDATVAARLDDRLLAKLVATAPILEPMVQAWVAEWDGVVLHDPAALLIAAGDGTELARFERRRLRVEPDGRVIEGGQGASGTVHDVVTSLFGVAVVASVLALLADLKLTG